MNSVILLAFIGSNVSPSSRMRGGWENPNNTDTPEHSGGILDLLIDLGLVWAHYL